MTPETITCRACGSEGLTEDSLRDDFLDTFDGNVFKKLEIKFSLNGHEEDCAVKVSPYRSVSLYMCPLCGTIKGVER